MRATPHGRKLDLAVEGRLDQASYRQVFGDGREFGKKAPAHAGPDHAEHPVVAFGPEHHRRFHAHRGDPLGYRHEHLAVDAVHVRLTVEVLHLQHLLFSQPVIGRQDDNELFSVERNAVQAFVLAFRYRRDCNLQRPFQQAVDQNRRIIVLQIQCYARKRLSKFHQ